MTTKKKLEYQRQRSRFESYLKQKGESEKSPFTNNELESGKLLQLCFPESKTNLSLHAIWFLEKYLKAYPRRYPIIFSQLIENLPDLKKEGSQRIAGNIIIESFRHPDIFKLHGEDVDIIIETTFEWLITPSKAVAVVANCFEILYHFTDQHQWIQNELIAQIEHFLKDGSVAVQARGSKFLKKLKKNT